MGAPNEERICAVRSATGGAITGYVYDAVPVDRSRSTGRDAAGTRVARGRLSSFSCNFATNGYSTTTSWVLGPGGEQVTEYAVSGSASTWVHSNVFAGARLNATYSGADTYFALSDWLGTRRVEVDATGVCATAYQSLPFGNGLAPATVTLLGTALPQCNPDATEHHFTGKERDAESGNDYFGARYYGSSMGRFMSPDDASDQRPENPQSWNLYSYVHNNPVTNTDSDGRSVNVCTNDANGNQQCSLLSNEQYTAAQQGNGSLNVPTLNQVGMNGDGNGSFNSTGITDSNGNNVGSATYVSDGGGAATISTFAMALKRSRS